jgi:hypothetical protein
MQRSDSEPDQNSFLHPGIYGPSSIVFFCGANLAMAEELPEAFERRMCQRDFMGTRAGLEEAFDVFSKACGGW